MKYDMDATRSLLNFLYRVQIINYWEAVVAPNYRHIEAMCIDGVKTGNHSYYSYLSVWENYPIDRK